MIETERLIIRPWRDSDRAEYLATCNTKAVTAHLGGPASTADIDAALGRIAKSQEENGFCFWAVERRSDGAFLGYCGLKIARDPGTPIEGDIEIGWRLAKMPGGRAMPSKPPAHASIGPGGIWMSGGWSQSLCRRTRRAGQ
jgi:RimJ/RimL family protein N-acetyltransferase